MPTIVSSVPTAAKMTELTVLPIRSDVRRLVTAASFLFRLRRLSFRVSGRALNGAATNLRGLCQIRTNRSTAIRRDQRECWRSDDGRDVSGG